MKEKEIVDINRLSHEIRKKWNVITIENTLVLYVVEKNSVNINSLCPELIEHVEQADKALLNYFYECKLPYDIVTVIDLFETLIESETASTQGIVFTPKSISDYIVNETLNNYQGKIDDVLCIDPGCGCGVFLISFIEALKEKTNNSYKDIIEKQVFGIDIELDNVKRCKTVLKLFCAINGVFDDLKLNIANYDSLVTDWSMIFGSNGFDVVCGNPPYVNPHDMAEKTTVFLRDNFTTTKQGTFNIYYAFIEKSLESITEQGEIGFILPNNLLTIKSASLLRQYLVDHDSVRRILDFGTNMVFRPVRTYSCLLFMNRKAVPDVMYYRMSSQVDMEVFLTQNEISYITIPKITLNSSEWRLADSCKLKNIERIESQFFSINKYIRTGIATLRDSVYIVKRLDVDSFSAEYMGEEFPIETEIVKPLIKIPEYKEGVEVSEIQRYIIFPYHRENGQVRLMSEDYIKNTFPNTYQYLLIQKDNLDSRDKGKPNPVAWYAYGRTQGLNNFGRKLIFPTFAHTPRFRLLEQQDMLICNGYALFENSDIDIEVLEKVLNSKVMDFYIKATSYAIGGDYYCYQKKYLTNFSVPFFHQHEIDKMNQMSRDELDEFLYSKYELTF